MLLLFSVGINKAVLSLITRTVEDENGNFFMGFNNLIVVAFNIIY